MRSVNKWNTDGGKSCHVLALDRATGKVLWDTEAFQQVLRRKQAHNSFATPTPVTDGELLYAAFCDGAVAALTLGLRGCLRECNAY